MWEKFKSQEQHSLISRSLQLDIQLATEQINVPQMPRRIGWGQFSLKVTIAEYYKLLESVSLEKRTSEHRELQSLFLAVHTYSGMLILKDDHGALCSKFWFHFTHSAMSMLSASWIYTLTSQSYIEAPVFLFIVLFAFQIVAKPIGESKMDWIELTGALVMNLFGWLHSCL
ncbi:hypothetical protein SDJN03_01546, partial [Cucurbita argyrosperma subsp. sororia]